jgi:hypothetical protein
VELFEQIRREYEYGEGTIKGVARKLGIHRRMVREALGDAIRRERKISTRGKPTLEPAKPFSEAILQAHENAPRKQRHTAHRIWSPRISPRGREGEVEFTSSSIGASGGELSHRDRPIRFPSSPDYQAREPSLSLAFHWRTQCSGRSWSLRRCRSGW